MCNCAGECSPLEHKSCQLQKALDWAFRDVTNEEEAIVVFDSLLEILPKPDEGWEPRRIEVEGDKDFSESVGEDDEA